MGCNTSSLNAGVDSVSKKEVKIYGYINKFF